MNKRHLAVLLSAFVLVVAGCETSSVSSGNCQDSVKILIPNPTSSASIEHICTRGSRLKVTDKDQSLVAVCRCLENVTKLDAAPDGIIEEKK